MKLNSSFRFLMLVIFIVTGSYLHAQKIGLLLDSYVTDRWYLDQKLFMDKVKELGGEVQIEVAYGDPAEQLRLGKKLITDGAKVLVIVPVDGVKSAEIVQKVKRDHLLLQSLCNLIYPQQMD